MSWTPVNVKHDPFEDPNCHELHRVKLSMEYRSSFSWMLILGASSVDTQHSGREWVSSLLMTHQHNRPSWALHHCGRWLQVHTSDKKGDTEMWRLTEQDVMTLVTWYSDSVGVLFWLYPIRLARGGLENTVCDRTLDTQRMRRWGPDVRNFVATLMFLVLLCFYINENYKNRIIIHISCLDGWVVIHKG